jgi:hypothetical protein
MAALFVVLANAVAKAFHGLGTGALLRHRARRPGSASPERERGRFGLTIRKEIRRILKRRRKVFLLRSRPNPSRPRPDVRRGRFSS